MMRYAIVIEKAEGNYSAYVPDLPGCVATGPTVETTEKLLRESIELHVQGLIEGGLPEGVVNVVLGPATGDAIVGHPLIRKIASKGSRTTAQTVSLMNAWLPRPCAKNEYRPLSCSSSPGSVSPRAIKASPAVPPSSRPATMAQAPATRPTISAVPVQRATARRQVGRYVPLNLTTKGSVQRPRDALSANAYVT